MNVIDVVPVWCVLLVALSSKHVLGVSAEPPTPAGGRAYVGITRAHKHIDASMVHRDCQTS